MITTLTAPPPPFTTSPTVPEPPAIILPAVDARIAHCRLASGLARRLGDEIAGYQPMEGGADGIPGLIQLLLRPSIEPVDLVVRSEDGSVAWTAGGSFAGRADAPEHLLEAAAATLRAAIRGHDALGVLASTCIQRLATDDGASAVQVQHITTCFQACDGVAPGWGRWAAALTAAVLAEEQWRRLGGLSRRDVSLLLWQCGLDAQAAADSLVARRPVAEGLGLYDGAVEAPRYLAAWSTCCHLLAELGQRMTAVVMAYVTRRVRSQPVT